MKLISVNVGQPQQIDWKGRTWRTAIFKSPVKGRVALRKHNLHGDRQSDLQVHGGPDKAVYLYPAEHYKYWQEELPEIELTYGNFGENLTTEGILETDTCIGDMFGIGTAVVRATEPRLPCAKLGLRFKDGEMVKRFLASRRTGFYLAVVEEGEVRQGDKIELLEKKQDGTPISDITRLYAFDKDDFEGLRKVIADEAVTNGWKTYFQEQLQRRA